MATSLPNGIGQSLGDSLATTEPLLLSGNVWYVDDATGTDAASPAGRNDKKPLKTLAQAVTNAADHDIIVFLPGHVQTLGAAQTISKRLTLVGAGSSGGLPTVSFTNNQAAATMFTISGADVELRNILFPANAQTCATARLTVTGARFRMIGCYMRCGATDTGPGLSLGSGADHCHIVNSTFISTATSSSSQPESAIKSTAALAGLYLDGVTLSGGTVGFSNYFAFDGSAAAITPLKATNLSLLLGADMALHADTVGYVNAATATQGARVSW